MKKKALILLSTLLSSAALLASCNLKGLVEVYKDNSEAKIGDLAINLDRISYSHSYSDYTKGYSGKIYLNLLNDGQSDAEIKIRDSFVACEDIKYYSKVSVAIEKEIVKSSEKASISYSLVTVTPLVENKYSLSTTINDVRYTLHLYNKPDSEREDFSVNYLINETSVKTLTVKENKPIGEDYIYENPNHLTHCSTWKDASGKAVGSSTRVNENINIYGKEKNNIQFASKDDPTTEYIASSLEYIPSDKVVVIPDQYNGCSVTEIGEGFFFSKQVKTIYLPRTIETIKDKNFFRCTILKTINFEGTEAEWNGINNLSKVNILDDVTINFETPFNA